MSATGNTQPLAVDAAAVAVSVPPHADAGAAAGSTASKLYAICLLMARRSYLATRPPPFVPD